MKVNDGGQIDESFWVNLYQCPEFWNQEMRNQPVSWLRFDGDVIKQVTYIIWYRPDCMNY